MAKRHVDAASLADLADGYGGKVIDRAIAAAYADIVDRGDDGQKRVVDIKITFTPTAGAVKVDITAGAKLPALRPYSTVAKIDAPGGGLQFSTDSAANPDQDSIPGLGREAE